jgi:D-alanyl-D-alanine carboxypeptidase
MYRLQKLSRSLKISVRQADRTQILRTAGILLVAVAVLGTSPIKDVKEEPKVQGTEVEGAKSEDRDKNENTNPSPSSIFYPPSSAPAVSAKAAFFIDNQTGAVLHEKNPDQRLPIASLTKIMTALVVLENFPLDEIITVPEVCANLPPSKIGLATGQNLTVEDLLYGALVVSAADAACTLSHHFDGDFLQLMNQKTSELGLEQTHFENEVGFDGENGNHLSTARDMVKLSQEALKNGVFRKIVGTKEVSIPGFSLTSTNELLFTLPGTTGIKTGETPEAKGCLAISYERGGHEIIGVLLGSDDRFADARQILDWVFEE